MDCRRFFLAVTQHDIEQERQSEDQETVRHSLQVTGQHNRRICRMIPNSMRYTSS